MKPFWKMGRIIEKDVIPIIVKLVEKEVNEFDKNLVFKFVRKEDIKKLIGNLKLFVVLLGLKQKFFRMFGKVTAKNMWFLESDIEVIEKSDGIIMIGVKAKDFFKLNCGLCGYKTCGEYSDYCFNRRFHTIFFGFVIYKLAYT